MKNQVGVWIDHKKAIIATLTGRIEHVRRTPSRVERRVGYYDEVVACIRDADSILIFGPGEAKIELRERLGAELLGARIAGIETVGEMTEHQVAAAVRQHFLKSERKLQKTIVAAIR